MAALFLRIFCHRPKLQFQHAQTSGVCNFDACVQRLCGSIQPKHGVEGEQNQTLTVSYFSRICQQFQGSFQNSFLLDDGKKPDGSIVWIQGRSGSFVVCIYLAGYCVSFGAATNTVASELLARRIASGLHIWSRISTCYLWFTKRLCLLSFVGSLLQETFFQNDTIFSSS